jgi:ACT domain-containing protein
MPPGTGRIDAGEPEGTELRVALEERPGVMVDVCNLLDAVHANIFDLEIIHDERRLGPVLMLQVDRHDRASCEQALVANGYRLL